MIWGLFIPGGLSTIETSDLKGYYYPTDTNYLWGYSLQGATTPLVSIIWVIPGGFSTNTNDLRGYSLLGPIIPRHQQFANYSFLGP